MAMSRHAFLVIILVVIAYVVYLNQSVISVTQLYGYQKMTRSLSGWLQLHLSQDDENRTVFCLMPRGRLGNRMFQFAAGYSLSKRYGRKLVIDQGFDAMLQTLFTMRMDESSPVPYSVGQCDKNMTRHNNRRKGFQGGFFTINSTEDLHLISYFESWKYFYRDIKEIRMLFTPKDQYMNLAKTTIRRHCPANVTSIGVQIRRGDKQKQQSLAPLPYFHQAMDYYTQKYSQVHFFVASDNIKWCRESFQNRSDVTFLTGNAFEDLAVLSECEHSIISVGTYSWWSGMLAKGTVIYYTSTTRRVPELFKDADFYPPHWIPMAGYEETLPPLSSLRDVNGSEYV